MTSLSQTEAEGVRRNKGATIVRPYGRDDIVHIRNKVMLEVPKLPHYTGIKVDARRIDQLMLMGLESDDQFMARVLVTPDDEIVGGVCGYCVTQLLSWDKMTGDIFLFVEPEWRSIQNAVKLIMSYREWALSKGATIIAATHTGGLDDAEQLAVFSELLKRFGGFDPVGTIFYYRPGADELRAPMSGVN